MNDDQKHLDATKPGNHPVSSTSRPIIVGRQQLTHDPMMRQESDEKQAEVLDHAQDTAPVEHQELKMVPPTLTKVPDKPSDSPESVPETAPETTKDAATQKEEGDQGLPASVIENEQHADPIPEDKTKELIENKTYKLPISQTPTKIVFKVVVGLIIAGVIVAAVVAYMMMGS